jgi:hypothetical protein
MSPLAFSTWPLDLGCETEAYFILMPRFLANSYNSPEVKLVPLSVMMLFGTPYR